MRSAERGMGFGRTLRNCVFCCALIAAIGQSACSIPNLESQPCSDARESVRQFYSWYIGTDPEDRAKQPEVFQRYISPNLTAGSAADPVQDRYFLDETTPTTFKVGVCKQLSEQSVEMQVQLYWRQASKVTQKEVHVEVAKTPGSWLIEKVAK